MYARMYVRMYTCTRAVLPRWRLGEKEGEEGRIARWRIPVQYSEI